MMRMQPAASAMDDVISFFSASLRALRLCVKQEEGANSRPGLCSSLVRCLVVASLLSSSGCQSPQRFWNSLKGEGFPEWNGQVAGGVRGKASEVKPSGFFTDRRSEQIEQNLGGGF